MTLYNDVTRHNWKYNQQRAECEIPTIIRDWFQLVRNIIEEYDILDEDFINAVPESEVVNEEAYQNAERGIRWPARTHARLAYQIR